MLTTARAFTGLTSRIEEAAPFQSVYHPMGHPIEISSNSPRPLEEAANLWHRYPCVSMAEPCRLSIVVDSAVVDCASPPLPVEIDGRFLSITDGGYHFATADLTAGLAVGCLPGASIRKHSYFRYHFLEPLAYVLLGARHFLYVHASCISRNGRAILLCGDSGAGKTCLAYACAKRGWDFVSGDAVSIVRRGANHLLAGRPYEIRFRDSACRLFPELHGFQPEVRPNGKLDIEIDTAQLPICTALESHAAHIVFIERSAVTLLEPCTPRFAFSQLAQTICYGDDRSQAEQRSTLTRLVELPLWRLRYAELDEAKQALEELLK